MANPQWKIIAQTRDRLGESPMWHRGEQALYWVDWYGPTIRRLTWGQEKIESWTIPGETIIGSFVFAQNGKLLIAVDSGLRLFDPATGTSTAFADPNEGRSGVAYNDSKLDRFGRLWVGTFNLPETEPRGILYCVDASGRWSVGDSGFPVCNGPAFSPDGRTMYFSDSNGRRVLAYDVSPETRLLSNRRVFAQFSADDGVPDGLTVDAEGGLWCALYGGGRVVRFAPGGQVLDSVVLPCPVVTAPGFGGPDMTTLFVTTGWSPGVQAAKDEPGPGGAVFTLETGIKGLAEPVFAV
jgi:sugar lactone lactonase YvrE